MEQVRDEVLDALCESIGDARDTMNAARNTEQADCQASLHRLQEKGWTKYAHAGVELLRVSGEEKLRVRTKKEATTMSDGDGVDLGDLG